MEKAIWRQATQPHFWEDYAGWYQQWLNHCSYHEKILDFVEAVARSGWRVLDIGAGSGVLSVPLSKKGCQVIALEPSKNMRTYLYKNIGKTKHGKIQIDTRPWEAVPPQAYVDCDLMVACNSLHVSPIGFTAGLRKTFRHKPKRLLLITEFVSPEIKVPLIKDDYTIEQVHVNKVKSSFAYHSETEAISHWSIQNRQTPSKEDEKCIRSRLVFRKNHFWMEDETWLGMYYWMRK